MDVRLFWEKVMQKAKIMMMIFYVVRMMEPQIANIQIYATQKPRRPPASHWKAHNNSVKKEEGKMSSMA